MSRAGIEAVKRFGAGIVLAAIIAGLAMYYLFDFTAAISWVASFNYCAGRLLGVYQGASYNED